MTDIVERLRITEADGRRLPLHEVRQEAADEIEQLAEEVGQLRRACASYVEVLAAEGAEIERLREHHKVAVDNWTLEAQTVKQQEDEIHTLNAKIERLRGLLQNAPCTCPNSFPWDWPHDPNNEDCYLNHVRKVLSND